MAYSKKIVLHCTAGYHPALDTLIEDFIRDGVAYVAVVGRDCEKVERIIDSLVIARTSDVRTYMLVCGYPGESVGDAVGFAKALPDESPEEVQIVEF